MERELLKPLHHPSIIKTVTVGQNNIGAPKMRNSFGVGQLYIFHYSDRIIGLPVKLSLLILCVILRIIFLYVFLD